MVIATYPQKCGIITIKKKKDFINRLDDITLERIVNRDGIRICGNRGKRHNLSSF